MSLATFNENTQNIDRTDAFKQKNMMNNECMFVS